MSNVINVRKFIKENSEMRANPESCNKLKEMLETYGKAQIKKASEKVEARHQKTLKAEDFEEKENETEEQEE